MCKFSNNKSWYAAKRHLSVNYNISVHFSDSHQNYISAYRYVTKEDTEVFHRPGHSDLDSARSPQTSKANKALMEKRRSKQAVFEVQQTSNSSKRKRISKSNVMDIIKSRGMRSETKLLALANERADDGLYDLKTFIADTAEHFCRELTSKTWKLAEAPYLLARQWQSRMEKISLFNLKNCAEGCHRKLWLKMAKEILRNNKINAYLFAEVIRTLLELDRRKNRNILLVGPANCGNTFLLNPLTEIYDTFLNPSSSKYAFVGAENKELIFLNHLRWRQEMIPWQEFLNLLEGHSVHLAATKTHYARDILITDDVPNFATNIAPIMFAGKGTNVDGKNAIMEARWRKFQLSVQIPLSEQKTVKSCARCFCELVFMGADA